MLIGATQSPERCADDKTLKVWDLETGRELRTLEGHSGPVYGVAVSRDGRRVVSASGDNTLKVWDLEIGESLQNFLSCAVNGHHTSSITEG
jgi:WD40 repeat protein